MIKSYFKDGKKFYEVFVHQRDFKQKLICRRRRGITSERKAKEVELQLNNELYNFVRGGYICWTWKDWHQECLKRMKLSYKKSTLENYDGALKKWLPEEFLAMNLEKIKPQDIHKLIFETIGDRTTLHNLNFLLKLLKRLFGMAVTEGIISKNPTLSIQVKVPKTQLKVLNSIEATTLLKEALNCHHRFYRIWAVALMTGMRSGEMFALCWKDIDMETGLISVNKQWTNKDGIAPPKNRDNRVIPINDDLRSLIQEMQVRKENCRQEFWDSRCKENVIFDDLLLPRLKEWENGEQAQVLREFCKAIGITSIRFHDLRATFITNMLAQGVSAAKVMAIVGHRKTSTMDQYLRLAGVDINGATQNVGYQLPQKGVVGNVLSFTSPYDS